MIMPIAIAGGVFGLFMMIMMMNSSRSQKKNAQNLSQQIARQATVIVDDNTQTAKDKNAAKKTESITKKLKHSAASEGVNTNPKSIPYMMIQAGMQPRPMKFWMWSVISCVMCYLVAKAMGMAPISVICLTFFGLFGLPRWILKRKVAKRQSKFLEEMADCLDGMIRLLKSGMPISEAIAMTAREYTGPVGEEMTKVYEAQRVGDTLPEAVQKMAFRVPLPEVKMFSTAITIQTQTGSSLSDILQNLSDVIRGRFRLKRKVQALSAEAKISAMIIGALPLIVIGAMYLLNREYIELLWTTNSGKILMYGGIVWMGFGVMSMKAMINFKV